VAAEPNQTNRTTSPLGLVVVQEPESDAAQAYRSVRETIRFARTDSPIRSVLLADAGSRDQLGEAAANIAASFALNGDRTVLVDADSSSPALHQLLGTSVSPGLIDWLEAGTSDQRPTPLATALDRLYLMPPGVPTGGASRSIADRLTVGSCRSLIDEMSGDDGYVVFHAAVAPVSSQALTIAAQVDAVLLVVRSGSTKREDAQRAKESLERVGASLLGVVLTDVS
jgi:Mrp family chromosome partitioning ATPase